ncbi:cellulose binding domain-containing protein [Mycobacterium sp. Z3061]|uniref:cellulose binding domain-containing protein n=1 Tax=Mycobacterium sp. Z3061 TaxID=3073562 RepID=UPI003EB8EA0D
MSYVIATPEALAAAVTDIAGIGSSLSAANAAAAVPTTEILAAAADEISTAVASLFGAHALDYQSLSARVASFQAQFMDSLFAGAQRYAGAELLNGSLLRGVAERLLGGGRPGNDGSSAGSASAEATGAATSQPTGTTAKTTAAAATATATPASGGATGTGIKATYATTSQWNSGFVANYTITNTGTTPLTNWQLQFSLPTGESVANLWNGHVTQSGTQYTVTPHSYNATIAPGDSVTVGFQGAQSGTYSPPTNVSIGGQPVIGGPTPPVTTPPVTTPPVTTPPVTTPPVTTPPVTTPPAGTGGLTAAYTATSQWNSGFNGNYAITNSGTTPLSNWNLQFDLPANESITNLWNGQVTHTGSHYTVTPASYNGTIAPGGSVNVGFQASQTGSYGAPSNLLINGQPVTGGSTTPTPPTTTPPTTTPPTTTPPTGGTLISNQYGTTTVGNAYVVQNNAWNNPGGQAITVSQTGFTITTENGSAPTNGAPLGYPSIYTGWHYGTGSPGTILPIQLGQIQTATSSISYTYPTSGIYDAAYDIWLNPTPITTGVNQQEVMIWFNHTGPIQPVGSVVGNATIDGQNFAVWKGSNGQNNVVSYVANSPITTWNSFDVMGFIDNTQTWEPVTDSWYLTSIQAGFEPWSGSVGAGVNNFSASINGHN